MFVAHSILFFREATLEELRIVFLIEAQVKRVSAGAPQHKACRDVVDFLRTTNCFWDTLKTSKFETKNCLQ